MNLKELKKTKAETLILDTIAISKNRIKQYKKIFKKLVIFEDLDNKGQKYANLIFNSIINGPINKIKKLNMEKNILAQSIKF